MVLLPRRLCEAHRRQLALCVLFMAPHAIGPHVRAVQVRLRGVEDHAMNGGLRTVLVVLDVLGQGARGRSGEDVAEARVLVEGVAVDAVGGLLGGEDEDGARARVGVVCFG
jgi:hypothetical protein